MTDKGRANAYGTAPLMNRAGSRLGHTVSVAFA